jgi:predicted transcriptional regulator
VTDAVDAIISIHPGYATAILDGTKTIELRRRIPSLGKGARLWIYATRPTAAVVGVATIADVSRAHPRTIWQKHRAGTGVDYDSFTEYFAGTTEGIAILLAAARRVRPVSLEQLRKVRARFHPPQVLVRLTSAEAEALENLAKP